MKKKNTVSKKIRVSTTDRIVDVIIVIVMLCILICTAYPMYYVCVASVSSGYAVSAKPGQLFWPEGFNLYAYKLALEHPLIMNGYKNTLIVLFVSLPINLLMTLIAGYFMACENMKFKKIIVIFMMIPMYFSGGLIPGYLNIRDLGLYNSLWALILPGALSIFNAIICRTAIQGIPDSLTESAKLDGASDMTILIKIILPLIKATAAVLLLYYGVGHWNSWFPASIYLNDNAKMPVQNVLRSILTANNESGLAAGVGGMDNFDEYAHAIKYAAIVISTLPIVCVYPFLQKYFVKGTMVGAVKG